VLVAVGCKSPTHAWNDADITELLRFRRRSLRTGDPNAKCLLQISVVSKPSDAKVPNLLHVRVNWVSNFSTTISHSLLSCGKCPAVKSHCLSYSGLRSSTNRFQLAGSYYN
jgi:hypothetical protein